MCTLALSHLPDLAPDGRVGYVANHSHELGQYLRVALPHGFVVRACEKVPRPPDTVSPTSSRSR